MLRNSTGDSIGRRSLLGSLAGALALLPEARAEEVAREAPIRPREPLKITKLETFLVKPRWLFLKVHTNVKEIVGLGEPIVEGRALTCATAVKEIEPYLVGKDPRARGAPLAGDLPARVLSRRPDAHRRVERHRPGAVGHQGQGAGRAGVRTAGRPDARQGPRATRTPTATTPSSEARHRAGLHGLQDRAGQAPAGALHRDARPRCNTPASSSANSARRSGPDIDIAVDFHGAIRPAHGQDADQGAGALHADVHRGAVPGAEPRRDGRDRALARSCPSPPASASSPSGASARCWRSAPPRCCNPTCATPAASPRCG